MRTVVITGAAAGIGRATAERFAKHGDRVVIADIDHLGTDRAVTEITAAGGTAHGYRLDVSAEEQWEQFADWAAQQFGAVDVLINNAGILDTGGFVETSAAQWQRTVDIDVMSVIYGSRVFARQMIDRGVRGHIVNLSSAGAFFPARVIPAYATAKFAVLMASQALRVELRRYGIGVTAICPGAIRTDLLAHGERAGLEGVEQAAWREGTGSVQQLAFAGPDKVARAIERAVRRDSAIVPVNPEAWLAYGVFRLSPSAMRLAGRLGTFAMADALLPLAQPLLSRITK